jgi:hypothetical protein
MVGLLRTLLEFKTDLEDIGLPTDPLTKDAQLGTVFPQTNVFDMKDESVIVYPLAYY